MSLPTKVKTWEHVINQRIAWPVSGSESEHNFRSILAMKDLFKNGAFTCPWQVESSCDGPNPDNLPNPGTNVSNNTGVDYWAVWSDVYGTSPGVHSWVVLKQTAVNSGGLQVCIDCNGTHLLAMRWISFIFSPKAGFGAVNGGTDGTATSRPTATDEQTLLASGIWGRSAEGSDYLFHMQISDDGECTRLVICRGHAPTLCVLDVPKDPLAGSPGWADPVLGMYVSGGTTTGPTYGRISVSSYFKMQLNGHAVSAHGTSVGDGYDSASPLPYGQKLTGINDLDSCWQMTECGLFVPDSYTPANGLIGRIQDFRFVPTGMSDGDGIPSSANPPTYQWAVFGDIAVPWNGVTPQFS